MEVIDEINYQGLTLYIWGDLDEPWFLARDVGELLYINHHNATSTLLRMISPRNVTTSKVGMSGRRYHMKFINEDGLHEAFSRSYLPQAKMWNDISTRRLSKLRRERDLSMAQDAELRVLETEEYEWFDYERGVYMRDIGMDHHGQPISVELDRNGNPIYDEDEY